MSLCLDTDVSYMEGSVLDHDHAQIVPSSFI